METYSWAVADSSISNRVLLWSREGPGGFLTLNLRGSVREGSEEMQLGGGAVEGGEAAAAAAAVAGEAFGSHNGKHSFSLRVSVHQGRGPGGGGFVSSRLTLTHSHANVLGSSSQVVQQIKWAAFKPQVPRERQRGATRQLTVEPGRIGALADSGVLSSFSGVYLRTSVGQRGCFCTQ